LELVVYTVQNLTLPDLAEHPIEDFAGVRTLKFILDTALADGLQWSASNTFLRYEDPKAKHSVSWYPGFTAADIANTLNTSKVKNGLPLETCELYIGNAFVKKIHGLGESDRNTEWFTWETPPHD
jgi:hypothetical protein